MLYYHIVTHLCRRMWRNGVDTLLRELTTSVASQAHEVRARGVWVVKSADIDELYLTADAAFSTRWCSVKSWLLFLQTHSKTRNHHLH